MKTTQADAQRNVNEIAKIFCFFFKLQRSFFLFKCLTVKWARNCSICSEGKLSAIVQRSSRKQNQNLVNWIAKCWLLWIIAWLWRLNKPNGDSRRGEETKVSSLIASQMTFLSPPRSNNKHRFSGKKWKTRTRNTFLCTRKGKFPGWPQSSLTEKSFFSLARRLEYVKMHQVLTYK